MPESVERLEKPVVRRSSGDLAKVAATKNRSPTINDSNLNGEESPFDAIPTKLFQSKQSIILDMMVSTELVNTAALDRLETIRKNEIEEA